MIKSIISYGILVMISAIFVYDFTDMIKLKSNIKNEESVTNNIFFETLGDQEKTILAMM